jgi:hypothetical protein
MAVKFTNKFNLPEEFVDAITLDNHVTNGDISVTTLIDSPQVRMLRKMNDYEVDLTDQMAMFFGTAIHERLESSNTQMHYAKVLNQAAAILSKIGTPEDKGINVAAWVRKYVKENVEVKFPSDFLIEQTLTLECRGWTVSGTLDRYIKSQKKIRDYKTITASQLAFPEQKSSWSKQQNIYAVMLRKLGYEVESIEIVAIVKDWSKMKLATSKDYPRSPVVTIPLNVLDNEKMLGYIDARVAIHQRAEEGEQVPCTKTDRWAKEDSYAVKKKGGKRAIRVLPNPMLAQKFIDENEFKHPPGTLYIEDRPSESFRCKNYCAVSSICPQYARELEISAEIANESF